MTDWRKNGLTWRVRCYASGSDRIEGSRIAVSAYPNQGLDVPMDGYPTDEISRRSLAAKFICERTPFGTWVDDLVRLDNTGAMASQDGWGQDGDSWRAGDSRDQSA